MAQQLIHGSAGSFASAAFGEEHSEESSQHPHALSDQRPTSRSESSKNCFSPTLQRRWRRERQ